MYVPGRLRTARCQHSCCVFVTHPMRTAVCSGKAEGEWPSPNDPNVMCGTPVFVGTKVPLQTLLDYLSAENPLSEFLEAFPTVSREQAVAALEQAKDALLARAHFRAAPHRRG